MDFEETLFTMLSPGAGGSGTSQSRREADADDLSDVPPDDNYEDAPPPEDPYADVPPPAYVPVEDPPSVASSYEAPFYGGPQGGLREQPRGSRPTSTSALVGLNDQQLQAVEHSGAPLLIMAGAGSGKTRVLTHRIAHLLETGRATPGEILAITFTNKAAAEMRERVQKLVGPAGRHIWVSTFHSSCVRILRAHSSAAGLKSTFSIYDQQDSLRMISMVLKDQNVDSKRFTPRFVAGRISDLKNELITPSQYLREAPEDPVSQLIAACYKDYNQRLRRANSLDFDDLIMVTVQMLQAHPAIAEGYHRRFRQILVDEYQDTNHAQYVLIKTLVGDGKDGVAPGQLTVVGDSDQSIYAFRGASIRNIEEFEEDYTSAKTIFLEQNYRSTQNILDAANAVISRNRGRRPKRLWTAEGRGDLVALDAGDSEYEEARIIIAELDELASQGADWGDIALFYRTNAQSRVLEERLLRSGIPYRIVGGTRFYERAEVKDALAYLQTIVNPDDTVAVRRVLNTPRRGIGDKAQAAIAAHADRYQISFGAALADTLEGTERPIDGLSARARASAAEFWSLIEEARALDAQKSSPSAILEEILDRTGYLAQLRASEDPQDASRVDNLAELVSVAEDFAVEAQNTETAGDLGAFLERTALVADADQIPGEEERHGQVTLMTVHTAKGLEFPYVFVTGMEDGTFPHRRSLDDEADLAEERRLAYVALTRARKRLYLTRAASRSAWGAIEQFPPSRFLDDLPEEVVEVRSESTREQFLQTGSDRNDFDSDWGGYGSGRSFSDDDGGPVFGSGRYSPGSSSTSRKSSTGIRRLAGGGRGGSSPAKPLGAADEKAAISLRVGDAVSHATLGEGVVIGTEGSGRSAVAKVQFASETKRLLLRMAPLTKL